MSVALIPVGPGVPPELSAILQSHQDAILALQQPGAPRPLWSHGTASTLQATAPAADYPDCYAVCQDINSVVVSTLVAGSYAWRRADGTAL